MQKEVITCKECQYSFLTFDKTPCGLAYRVCLLGCLGGDMVGDADYCSLAIKKEVKQC